MVGSETDKLLLTGQNLAQVSNFRPFRSVLCTVNCLANGAAHYLRFHTTEKVVPIRLPLKSIYNKTLALLKKKCIGGIGGSNKSIN